MNIMYHISRVSKTLHAAQMPLLVRSLSSRQRSFFFFEVLHERFRHFQGPRQLVFDDVSSLVV